MGDVAVTPLVDVSSGAWLSAHLTTLSGRIRGVVPAAYAAHVLVAHQENIDGGRP